jgi:hypothetical protein
MDLTLKNPTQGTIRMDRGGSGMFDAPRKRTNARGEVERYRHRGTDISCTPGQDVVSPIDGTIIRLAHPYANDSRFSGVNICNTTLTVTLFYVTVPPQHVGRHVRKGEKIGTAQDISKKYPDAGVTPHVHIAISSLSRNPENYIEGLL